MVSIQVYSENRFALSDVALSDLPALRADPNALLWVDLDTPSQEEIKLVLEEAFGFHPLAIEDCVSDSPYPKIEAYDDFIYIVLHVLLPSTEADFIPAELDLFIGRGFLVTYHRKTIPAVQATFQRYAKAGATVRGPDRFLHTLFDNCVAGGKPTIDGFRRQVEQVQSDVLANVSAEELFPRVVHLRKAIARLRQFLRPQYAIANELAQGKNKVVRAALTPYFRDLAEDLARLESEAAMFSEQLIISFRIYLNKSTHDANAGIRILTGLTALTFPTLLVSGWFGLNFRGMEELHRPWGYPLAIALVVIGTAATAIFMRRRRWL